MTAPLRYQRDRRALPPPAATCPTGRDVLVFAAAMTAAAAAGVVAGIALAEWWLCPWIETRR